MYVLLHVQCIDLNNVIHTVIINVEIIAINSLGFLNSVCIIGVFKHVCVCFFQLVDNTF